MHCIDNSGGGAHKLSHKSSISELVKLLHIERSDPLCGFFTKLRRSDTLHFVLARSFTADGNLQQPNGVFLVE